MSINDERETLQKQLSTLIAEITGGNLDCDQLKADTDFSDTGMNSVEYLELIDRIETKFDIAIDLESDWSLTSIDSFLDLLSKRNVSA